MKITHNGVEIDYSKLKDFVIDDDSFDTLQFSKNINIFKSQLEKINQVDLTEYSKKEIKENMRLVESLSNINKKLDKYNLISHFENNQIEEVIRLIQIKAYLQEYKRLNTSDYIKVPSSGIFSLVTLYIVPFNLINTNFDSDIKMFSDLNLQIISGNNYCGIPDDALLGSCRRISATHFAIIKNTDFITNKYLNQSNAWRFISSYGESV